MKKRILARNEIFGFTLPGRIAPKGGSGKLGKNHLKQSDFDFFKFFWSICLKNYYCNTYYQNLESSEQKHQKTKISSIFHIFSKNGCK